MAGLRCGDVVLRGELSFVFVRKGKGGGSRQVRISSKFVDDVKSFLAWKAGNGEGVGTDDFLLFSPRSKRDYSTRGLQFAFKRCLGRAGVSLHHSIHHARHTYASLLLVSSNNNVRLVQKQLGHKSIVTTQTYLDLFESEMRSAIEGLL